MTFTIFRRHNPKKCNSLNRYDPRCRCPLWVQFVWKGSCTLFEGKKLAYQNKWSLETRSWTEAQSKVLDLEKRLNDFASGKTTSSSLTVAEALEEWYKFRDQNALGNIKAKQMGKKLAAYCEQNDILLLSAFTTDKAISWRLTLPHKTGDSSSLKTHWSVITGFFSWAVGMNYIDKTPIPDPRIYPQFRIRYKKAEVKPPTTDEINKILNSATDRTRILCLLMRETGMALVDALKFGMTQEDAEKFGMSKPDRHPVIQNCVIRGNRTKTNERYRVRISESLANQLEILSQPVFADTYSTWRLRINKAIKDAGVKTTPHGFRHFRITELLSVGVHVDDVSSMVGASSKEIRRTYEHWIKEAEDRLDEVQREAWLKMGLDKNGNKI